MHPQADRTIHVFEKTPKWVPELQRQFYSDDEVQVRTISSLAHAEDSLGRAANPILIVQLDVAPADCLRLLARLSNRSKHIPAIVLSSAEMVALEWPVRELGAVEFRSGFVPGFEIADLCRRQWSAVSRGC